MPMSSAQTPPRPNICKAYLIGHDCHFKKLPISKVPHEPKFKATMSLSTWQIDMSENFPVSVSAKSSSNLPSTPQSHSLGERGVLQFCFWCNPNLFVTQEPKQNLRTLSRRKVKTQERRRKEEKREIMPITVATLFCLQRPWAAHELLPEQIFAKQSILTWTWRPHTTL